MAGNGVLSINQALNYIYKNLDNDLTVEQIADQCCFSQYYFNRVFKGIVGESIYSFIKRMRLERAAFHLKTSQHRPITDIALEAGYSPSNFASAFRQYFGVSASEFRRMGNVPLKDSYGRVAEHIRSLRKNEGIFEELDARLRIKRIEAMNLVYRRVVCNYTRDLKAAWESFCTEMEARYGVTDDARWVGISYDDPLIADEERCIYDMGLAVDGASGADVQRIEAGLYACFEFSDRLDKLVLSFNEILTLWLPFCKYELDNRPSLEIYRSGLDDQGRIQAEICIPITDGKI